MRTSAFSATSAKIFASVVLVGGAAGVAGLGTFGSFTSTTSAGENVTSGQLVLGLTQHSTLGTSVSATGLVPGDTIQRALTLTRSAGSESFGSVKLTTSGSSSNVLTTDTTKGLQLTVDQCSVGWTQVGSTNQLTCSGTTTNIIASRAVIGSNLDLGAATTTLNSGASASNLRLQLVLPSTADNPFQNLSNSITFTFDATQRTADFR